MELDSYQIFQLNKYGNILIAGKIQSNQDEYSVTDAENFTNWMNDEVEKIMYEHENF